MEKSIRLRSGEQGGHISLNQNQAKIVPAPVLSHISTVGNSSVLLKRPQGVTVKVFFAE